MDSMCQSLKVLQRFMKASLLGGKCGIELADIPCSDVKLQLSDSELNIGGDIPKALRKLKKKRKMKISLSKHSFICGSYSISHANKFTH